jgi:hypothetical protein
MTDFRRFGGAATTLLESVDAASSQIVVNYSPEFPKNPPFDIVIDSEICTVQALSSSSALPVGLLLSLTQSSPALILTVSRAQESTTATRHLFGRSVTPVLTKKAFLAVADDKGYASVRPVPATSITLQLSSGNGISLIDPMTNEWRRFPATPETLPPILNDGESADIFAHWNESLQDVMYFMFVWPTPSSRAAMTIRDGVLTRTDSYNIVPRRYVGTVQKQGSLFTPGAYRVGLATANNLTVRHEGFKVVRLNPTVSSAVVHGLQAARDGKMVVLSNISSSQGVLLKHASVSALTNEKFLLPQKGDLTIPPGGGVSCIYDVASRAWRFVANCFFRPSRETDPDIVENALEDGEGNLLAYADESDNIILYKGI